MLRLLCVILFAIFLGACNSSPIEQVTPSETPEPLPDYQPLLDSATSELSQLAGSVITARRNDTQVRRVSGRLRHGGGKLVIDDGLLRFADEDGFDANGVAENEVVVLSLVNPGGKYEHASLYSTSYSVDGANYSAVGAIGVATRLVDMPIQGTARYAGDAVYAYSNLAGTGFGGVGTLDARVDFTNGTVDANVTLNTAQNAFTRENIADPEFDRIDMRGLLIDGTAFSGTDMRAVKDNRTVQVTGDNSSARVEGQFYGAARASDGSVIPDEIAGEGLLAGDDGNIILSFIGD